MGLYGVADTAEHLARLLELGLRTVQLRIKHLPTDALRQAIRQSIDLTRKAGAQLFINDHWQLALAEGAYGVHLGQEDLANADLYALQQAGLRLGVSTHSFWEICRAIGLQASYIACGPIHFTTTKAMPWVPQGTGNLAYWCRLLAQPVVAIGGMTPDRAAEALRCGASGVAVLSGLSQDNVLPAKVQGYQVALQAARSQPPMTAPWLPQTSLLNTAAFPLDSPVLPVR